MNVGVEFCANAVCPIFLIVVIALIFDRIGKSFEGVIPEREQGRAVNESDKSSEQEQVMSEQLQQYKVKWHTSPSPGASFYNGEIKVFAENDEDAEDRARQEVHRRMFPDYRNSYHIVIDGVSR